MDGPHPDVLEVHRQVSDEGLDQSFLHSEVLLGLFKGFISDLSYTEVKEGFVTGTRPGIPSTKPLDSVKQCSQSNSVEQGQTHIDGNVAGH